MWTHSKIPHPAAGPFVQAVFQILMNTYASGGKALMCIICVIFKSLANLLVPLPNQANLKTFQHKYWLPLGVFILFSKPSLKRKRFDEVRYVEVCDCCFYRDEILRVELSHAAATNLVLS